MKFSACYMEGIQQAAYVWKDTHIAESNRRMVVIKIMPSKITWIGRLGYVTAEGKSEPSIIT